MKTYSQRLVEHASEYLTPEYRELLVKKLSNAYLEEIGAFYNYFTVIPFLCGQDRVNIQKFYEDAAKDELYDHAAWLLKRISELGGDPVEVVNIANLNKAQHIPNIPYVNSETFQIDVFISIADNIQAEKDAIETYRDIEEYTRSIDIVTNDKIKHILADEVEHLQELEDFACDQNSVRDKCQLDSIDAKINKLDTTPFSDLCGGEPCNL